MNGEIQDDFAFLNCNAFQPGDIVIHAFGLHANGLSGTVTAFLTTLAPTNGPGVNVNWVDGTNTNILCSKLRRA